MRRLLYRYPRGRVPILMYHGVRYGPCSSHPYYEINTAPSIFAQQMDFLKANGFSTVRIEDALNYIAAGGPPKRYVVLTFDDGYRDFYTEAYPLLRRCGFTATVFLISAATGSQRLQFKDSGCLTWSEVRELRANGIGIGSHSVSHGELRFMSAREVDYEVGRSKEAIEQAIGEPIDSFSYPFAFPEPDRAFVARLERILRERGYKNGVSTIIGTAKRGDNPFFLPRLPVNTWDDPPLFQAKIEGAYDWVHGPQWLYKTISQRVQFKWART